MSSRIPHHELHGVGSQRLIHAIRRVLAEDPHASQRELYERLAAGHPEVLRALGRDKATRRNILHRLTHQASMKAVRAGAANGRRPA